MYILKGFSRLIVGYNVQWRWISLWDVLLWKRLYQGKLFYVGLGLFQSLPCRYLQRTLLFLCLMQLHGFDNNCFHWTQIRFLSLRIRPSILWVGPGYNYTESSSSHQCVRIISCHLICSNCFYLQQIFFCSLQLFFICSNYFLFAATSFVLQQLFYLQHVPCGPPY